MGVARVPVGGGEFGQRRGQHVHGVARQVWVGDVALHALHGELAAERAAAAVFDGVAGLPLGRGLAHDAPVEPLATALQLVADHHGAVVGWAFFVGGEQKS